MIQGIFVELRKDRANAQGEMPVRVRRKDKYKSAGFSIKPEYWNEDTQRVKRNHPKALAYNKIIENTIQDFEDVLLGNEKHKVTVSLEGYVAKHIKEWRAKGQRGTETLRQYKSELTKIDKFKPDITIQALQPKLFTDYWIYMKDELGNTENTIWKSFKFIRMVVNLAIGEGVLNTNPFLGYEKPRYTQKSRNYLTADLVVKLKEYATGNEATHKAARLFLFACYTGFRFSDLQKTIAMGKLPLNNGRLIISTQKTGEPVGIMLSDDVRALLKWCLKDKYIVSNVHANRALKAALNEAGLPAFTFHEARHTFGMRLLEVGASIETASTLLGHRSIKTTQIYARVGNKRIDDELKNFSF